MRVVLLLVLVCSAIVASAQSLHFVADGHVPFQQIAQSFSGKLCESRIDVLRSKRDWDEYYSAQNGFFGGPVVTSMVQPDFCQEQVVAVNLGSIGTQGALPVVRSVKCFDDETWEVIVDAQNLMETPKDSINTVSPYVAVRTPYGPDNYRFVFITNAGEEVIELRSSRSYSFPRDWWEQHRYSRNRSKR